MGFLTVGEFCRFFSLGLLKIGRGIVICSVQGVVINYILLRSLLIVGCHSVGYERSLL